MVDACVCHGAAGNGHLFNRLYQATGEPAFSDAARDWLERALEMRQPGQGVAGFLTWNLDDSNQFQWLADPEFFDGAAGIGLTLLAAVTPVKPNWDRLLLVDIPPDAS